MNRKINRKRTETANRKNDKGTHNNNITMTLQVDHLIMEALREDISSEDVTTNAVMHEAVTGEVDLICKQDGVVAGLEDISESLRIIR